jgi:hypothetical protein
MPSLIPEVLNEPRTHALVIGVSRYLHLEDGDDPTANGTNIPISQLSAAARSASEFADWLIPDPAQPEKHYNNPTKSLGSLRVLLSPSPGEQVTPRIQTMLTPDSSTTRANVEAALAEFINACQSNPDNVAIVYVAGHGVQISKHGAIVLLEDFGADNHLNLLHGAIDMAGVHAGMNVPGFPNEQFWFVDACRHTPAIARRFEELAGALKLDVPASGGEISPLILAATTGETAYARPGGRTLFYEALEWAFAGGAATGPKDDIPNWHISVNQLIEHLPKRVNDLALEHDAEQNIEFAGKIGNIILQHLDEPPEVNLTISLMPDGAAAKSTGKLSRNGTDVVISDHTDWPLQLAVKAGLYIIEIEADDPFQNIARPANIEPPSCEEILTVTT